MGRHSRTDATGAPACPHPDQLTFDDVVDSERIPGDSEYTQWLANGRPRLDTPPTVELDTTL